jgi:putative N6-adenine-specific DNA methylase
VEATLRDSEHTHSGFVALKVKDAIADRMREKLGRRPNVDSHSPDLSVAVHLSKEKLSLAIDLVGEPLHQRGYRIQAGAAPLKTTLAAALLRATGYTGQESLVDPMCGSGTILIEAASIAANRAPNLQRKLGVERWPKRGRDATAILDGLRAEAIAAQRKPPHPIIGFDRDEDAVKAARQNAAAGKLGGTLRLEVADAMQPLPLEAVPPGLLITNPPYGSRLSAGGQKGMKTFYFKLGETLRQLQGWRMFILAGNPAFESAFHLKPTSARTFWNGPIECRLLGYPPR